MAPFLNAASPSSPPRGGAEGSAPTDGAGAMPSEDEQLAWAVRDARDVLYI